MKYFLQLQDCEISKHLNINKITKFLLETDNYLSLLG